MAALKAKLAAAMGGAFEDSDLETAENMSTASWKDQVSDDEIGVGPGGVERNLDGEHMAATPTAHFPERSRGFTGAIWRQLHVAGAAYFASVLCTTTALLNSLERPGLLDVVLVVPNVPGLLDVLLVVPNVPGLLDAVLVVPDVLVGLLRDVAQIGFHPTTSPSKHVLAGLLCGSCR